MAVRSLNKKYLCSLNMKFICLLLLTACGIKDSRSEQYEVIRAAVAVFASVGDDVILPCSGKPNISVVDMRVEWRRSDLKDSLVHLYEDHEDRETEQNESYRGRTQLIHPELQRGNASLRLSSVKVSDEGRYKCIIGSESSKHEATVDLTVEALGWAPVITIDGFNPSGGLHLQCESEGWYPEPHLEWLDHEGVSLRPETTETHQKAGMFSIKHTIIVYHSDDKIHCRVKLKHHMLEAQIITSREVFKTWRTTAVLISVIVVFSGFAAMMFAVLLHKYRENRQLKIENKRLKQELDQLLQSQKTPEVTLDAGDSGKTCHTGPEDKEILVDNADP